MNLFKKFFCAHKWKTHCKAKYNWTEKEVVEATRYWFTPIIEPQEYESTTEVIFCENCGEIKIIEY